MPWGETCPMDERVRFIADWSRVEETMAELCRRYGISRDTGYLWVRRYRREGAAGLVERSRAPLHHPQAVDAAVERAVLTLRAAHPTWGPKKLVAALRRDHPALRSPAASTVGLILKRAGLVVPRRRRAHAPPRTQPLAHATAPNVVWCADFKGDFALGDGRRCYPLTISDAASRFLLRCQALPAIDTARVRPLFAATFREYGLPDVLRTDNGPPFASTGAAGLTPLSVWWVKLGIRPERIDPGKPGQNGRHERLHRTLKAEAVAPPAANLRAPQRACDRFRQEYNAVRPHEALGQATPASHYAAAARSFPDRLPELTYPDADAVRRVRHNGELRWHGRLIYVSQTLAGEPIGLTQVADGRWHAHFGPLLLGILDERHATLRRPTRPASTNTDVSAMSPV
jgi:putative transposase